MASEPADLPGAAPSVLAHKCGRCRVDFPPDPLQESEPPEGEWWLCPACRIKLLGDVDSTDARWE
jgi:hypothetical protein